MKVYIPILAIFCCSVFCKAGEVKEKPTFSEESYFKTQLYRSKCSWSNLSDNRGAAAIDVFNLVDKSTRGHMDNFLSRLPKGKFSYAVESFTLKHKTWKQQTKWYFIANVTLIGVDGTSWEVKFIVALDGNVFPMKLVGVPKAVGEK